MLEVMVVRIGQKGAKWSNNAGIRWSNGLAPQSNDRCGYWPKDYLCDNRIAGMGFWIPGRLEEEMGELKRLQKKRRFRGQCQKVSLTTHEDRE